MRFLLDANFLMIPGKFRVDVFRELEKFGKVEAYTPDLVVSELEKLAAKNGKDAAFARVALKIIKQEGVKIIYSEGTNTDSEIKRISAGGKFAVCTADKELIKSLKKENIPIITLRQKKYLVMA